MLLMTGIATILLGAPDAGPVNGLLPIHTNYEERRRNQQTNREAIIHLSREIRFGLPAIKSPSAHSLRQHSISTLNTYLFPSLPALHGEGVTGPAEYSHNALVNSFGSFVHAKHPADEVVLQLSFEGARNFRDFGGYINKDGNRIRRNLLYRSGSMHKFTNRDIALFAKLNVKVIFDLRTRSERILEPRNSDLRSTEILEFPDRHGGSLENFAAFIDDPNTNGPAMVEAMKQMYRELLIEQKTSYSAIFSKLVAGDLPLVVQCTAGKDRTGIIVALILATLDVPEDAIIADYMLSEQIVDLRNAFDAIEKNRMVGGMREEVIIAVLRSDNRYIQAALDAAKEKHGSVVAFVKAEYGVSDDDLTQIRKRLLVPDRPHFEAPVSPKARS